MSDSPPMSPAFEQASRDALGMLRAAARGDDDAVCFCAAHAADVPLTATVLVNWLAGAYAYAAASGGYTAAEIVEQFAGHIGL